jgi:hypothetical protein
MQRLGDLFGIILNLIFIFATVSYVATSIGDWLSELLRWRAKLLLENAKALLDDPQFRGAAKELYNNLLFNPLGNGQLRSEAHLSDYSSLPINVDPLVFGQAMIEILGLEKVASDELAKTSPDVNKFLENARGALAAKHDALPLSDRLYDLALNMLLRNCNEAKATPGRRPDQQIPDILIGMIKEIGNWFSLGQIIASGRYRKRIRLMTFAVGFGLSGVLDLQPVPIGGSALGGKLPYGVAIFEWLIVAASTLLGASFWFEILKKISPGIVGGAPPPVAAAPDAAAAAAAAAAPAAAAAAAAAAADPKQ